MFQREPERDASERETAGAEVIWPAAFRRPADPAMLTAADIEAEYVDVLATISPRQRWAMQLYGAARALVAAEQGAAEAGPDDHRIARERLFKAEAERRNAKAAAG
jgi:hypothetical protein